MPACLNVDEIIRLIASELVASRARATAVSFACCRKNFEGPVLDMLWETQDRLLPLLKSFPVGVWNEGKCTVSAPITRVFLFSQLFCLKVFQKIPNNVGMGSFPEVRSKDARAQRTWDFRPPIFRGFSGSAALRHQRTHVSKSENSRVMERQWEVRPIHPSVLFSENYRHQHCIHPIRLPCGDGRSDGRRCPDAMSQLAGNPPRLPTKGANDHFRCLRDAYR